MEHNTERVRFLLMFFVGARIRIHDPDAGLIGKAFSQSKNFQVELSEHNLFADSD